MPVELEGGCLCKALRYAASAPPLWVTICYCRFCQRATGSDRMIEPIFERDKFAFTNGEPAVFTLQSEGSGKNIHVLFCPDCGTKLALKFDRWPDRLGVYVGALDTPDAVAVTPENSKHIFVSEARPGTILPSGAPIFDRHATEIDGTPIVPIVHSVPRTVGT